MAETVEKANKYPMQMVCRCGRSFVLEAGVVLKVTEKPDGIYHIEFGPCPECRVILWAEGRFED